MNTDNANKYLDEMQIQQKDVWDSKGIEHPLDCLLEDYHQEQLKLLDKPDVVEQSEQLQGFFEFYKQKFGGGFNTDVLEITLRQYQETIKENEL